MKSIRETIAESLNESKTGTGAIEQYAKSWTTEHDPFAFKEIVYAFLKGVRRGLEENKKYNRENEGIIIDDLHLIDEIEEVFEKHKS